MSFKHKFSYEEKVKIVTEYLNGPNGFRESCRSYNVSQSGLKEGSKCSKYFSCTKKNAVRDYLSCRLSVPEILIKYKIRSTTQLRKCIMKYNSHEELKTSGTGGMAIC